MDKGDVIYYARIVPQVGLYETLRLNVRTVSDDWFVAFNTKSTQSFLFVMKDRDRVWSTDMKWADDLVKAAKEKYGTRTFTKVKEGEED